MNVLPLCCRRFCECLCFVLLLLLPIEFSTDARTEITLAHASVATESRDLTSLWNDIVKQIKGVAHFSAQAITAVLDAPQSALAPNTKQNTQVTEKNDIQAELGTLGQSASVSIARASKTGSLLVNVPFTIANNLLVEADTSLGVATIREALTVGGQAVVNGLTVRGTASLEALQVRLGGSLGSLAVAGKTVLHETDVLGQLSAQGGVVTAGATIDTQGGKVFASNIINSITAGKNITITGTANDLIISAKSSGGGGSSAGVTSVNGSTGAVTLVGGSDIAIAGLVVTNNSTLDSVRLRGGCVGCITDADVLDALTINGGAIENTIIGSTTPALARFTELTVTTGATSTFGGSINLTGGCFAISGTCIGASVAVDELTDLLDVALATTSMGDVLVYNGTDWTNRATSTLGFGDGSFLGLSDTPNSFTAGALSFANASGSALTQSASLIFDGTSLAIGTTSALETLTVAGSAGLLGQGSMRFYDANSSNYVALRATSSVLSNVTWTLPAADGSANQILVTNGAGQLSFTSIGALGTGPSTFLELTDTVDSYINKAIPYVATSTLTFSSDFVFDGSRVGIGTNAPTSTLTVVGSVHFGPSVSTPAFFYDNATNNIGIGTSNPTELLTLEGGSFLQRGAQRGRTYVPDEVGTLNFSDNANDVAVVGTHAYIASGATGNEFHVVNITESTAPVEVASLDLPANANALTVVGKYAYVVTDISTSEFHIIDISNPSVPVDVSSVNLSTTAFDVFVYGRYAYVVTGGTGDDFHIIDIANPLSPQEVGSFNLPSGVNGVQVSGKYAYIAMNTSGNEFRVIDISNPASPIEVGSVDLPASANEVYVQDGYAYVVTAASGDGFHVIDIADATAPALVGGMNLGVTALGVTVAGSYAYVTTSGTGNDLHVIDVSIPANPMEIGNLDLASGSTFSIAISGNLAYAVTSSVGDDLHIIDISGITTQSAYVHSLRGGSIAATGNIQIAGSALLGEGLRAGAGGIQTDGTLLVAGTDASLIAGRLGIGTTTPSEELTVSGDLRLTGRLYDSVNSAGVNGSILRSIGTGQTWVATSTLGLSSAFANSAQLGVLLSDETGSGNVVFSSSPTVTGTLSAEGLSLSAALTLSGATANISLGSNYLSGDGGDEGVFVSPSGLVGIGTSTPAEELTVAGTIQSTVLLGGATSLSTDAQGNIIRTPSDERLKTDVATIEGALEKVLALRGVTYAWQDTERFGDQLEIGFLAQEVDLILPEAVRKGGEYWSLNTSNIVAAVVEAVKEMWGKIEGQQGEIETLKERVEYLESQLGTGKSSEYEPVPIQENTTDEIISDEESLLLDESTDTAINESEEVVSTNEESLIPVTSVEEPLPEE